MTLSRSRINCTVTWTDTVANTPFADSVQGEDSIQFLVEPPTSLYNYAYLGSYTIAASGTQVLDFRSFSSLNRVAVTGTGILGLMLSASNEDDPQVTGAKLRVEADATNGLAWFLGGTTPYLEVEVGLTGALLTVMAGVVKTVDATHRRLLLTNSGTVAMTVQVWGLIAG